jgi:hypothetical protein
MTGCRIGRLIESQLLAQRGLYNVFAQGIRALALRGKPTRGGLYLARVKLVELFDVSDDLGDLWRERAAFLVCNLKVRQLRDLFDVGFRDGHNQVFSSQ